MRWLRKLYLLGLLEELKLGRDAEVKRDTNHRATMARYDYEIERLEQKIDRIAGRATKVTYVRTSPWLNREG